MKINYSDARCGAGKTYWACEQMAKNPGRYLLAVDRRVAGQERENTIMAFAAQFGTNPNVIHIYSQPADDGGKIPNAPSVKRLVEDQALKHRPTEHVVVIITHAGMKLADLADYRGWTLIVDEVPSILDFKPMKTGAMLAWFQANYKLIPRESGGSSVKFVGAFKPSDLADEAKRLKDFHSLVLAGDTRVSLTSWTEPGKWSAWRIWPVTKLSQFKDVYMLGDSVLESETARLLKREGVMFQEIAEIAERDAKRHWAARPLTIRYFAEDHEAGSKLFSKPEFSEELAKVGRWIAANTPDKSRHLWTCNDKYAATLAACGIEGVKVQPLQAGTNSYTAMVVASMIYTAKASPEEGKHYLEQWNITRDEIIKGRERYGLKQFFLRTAMRLPENTEPLEFRLYDKAQALDLGQYLQSKYGVAPVYIFEDVGIVLPKKETKDEDDAEPARVLMTPEEKRAAETRRKRIYRARKLKLAKAA